MLGRVSIRTKLILGFVLGITFSAVVGLVAVDKLRTVGRLATDLYDKPLQSVDFGRVAQIDFRDLASARRLASVPDPMLAGEAQTEYHRARRVLDEDLRVAMRRAASPPVAARLTRVLGQLEQWDRLVPPDLISATDEAAIETLARDIQAEIDRAVEDAKADGFAFVENARQVAADARSTTVVLTTPVPGSPRAGGGPHPGRTAGPGPDTTAMRTPRMRAPAGRLPTAAGPGAR